MKGTCLAAVVAASFALSSVSAQSQIKPAADEDRLHGTDAYSPANRRPNGPLAPREFSSAETAANACHAQDQTNAGRIRWDLTGLTNRSLDPAIVICGPSSDFLSINGDISEFGLYLKNDGAAPVMVTCTGAQGRGPLYSTFTQTRSVDPTPPPSFPKLVFFNAAKFGGQVAYPASISCTLPSNVGVVYTYARFFQDI